MKLIDIAKGWFNFIKASPADKAMIDARLSICDTCPLKAQVHAVTKMAITSMNAQGSVYYCRQCGCPLAGKTANPGERCPVGKWEEFKIPPTYY